MTLSAGSIAFVGFNADGNDGFAFIVIDKIPAGTVIYFNDNEWNGSAIGAGGAFNNGEGSTIWTNGGADLAPGTIVELLNTSVSASRSVNIGTLSGTPVITLGSSGESIFSFLGTNASTPVTFLTAITNNNGGFIDNNSGVLGGTGLTTGATALVLPGTGGADVAVYNPVTGGSTFASVAAAQTAFNTTANWVAQDGGGDQSGDNTSPDAPFLTDPQSPIAGVTFSIPAGDVDETFNAVPGIENIQGNGGNDIVIFDEELDIDIGDTFDGGAGTNDVLQSSVTVDFRETNLSNFENFTFTGTGTIGAGFLDTQIAGMSFTGRAAEDDRLSFVMAATGTLDISGVVMTDINSVVVTDTAGDDTVIGTAVRDDFRSAGGTDTLEGRDGNDIYRISGGNITIVETATGGLDFVYASVTYTIAANVERLYLTGTGNIGGTGNDDATGDLLYGNSGNNTLSGLAGTDTVRGLAGNDILLGGTGNDILDGGAGDDTLSGEADDDRLYGFDGVDTLNGGAGNDRLYGGDGIDQLFGDGEQDFLYGEGGTDSLFGGEGDDFLDGGLDSDTLVGGSGNDRLYGGEDGDTLNGDAGQDRLYGGDGIDALNGGADADSLYGEDGIDTLIGGGGIDNLFGGAGADTFVLQPLALDRDVIRDFVLADGDKLQVSRALFSNFDNDGAIAPDAWFQSNLTGVAETASDRFIYNTVNGALYFDADGSATGSARVLVASLTAAPALTDENFGIFTVVP